MKSDDFEVRITFWTVDFEMDQSDTESVANGAELGFVNRSTHNNTYRSKIWNQYVP